MPPPQEEELALWRSTLAGVTVTKGGGPEGVLALLEELRSQALALREHAGEREAAARHMQGELVLAALSPHRHAAARLPAEGHALPVAGGGGQTVRPGLFLPASSGNQTSPTEWALPSRGSSWDPACSCCGSCPVVPPQEMSACTATRMHV